MEELTSNFKGTGDDDKIKRLEWEVDRLRRIVKALMHGYDTIGEANYTTGKVEFFRVGSPVLNNLGVKGDLPPYDDLVVLYIKYGVYADDKEMVATMMDKEYLKKNLKYGQSIVAEYRNQDGIYGEMRIIRTGDDTFVMGFIEKNSEIVERNRQIYTDSLTLIHNRRYYDDVMTDRVCQAVVMADIDRFKEINDTYGHVFGDRVVSIVANVLRSEIRDIDQIARYGGDEFVIGFRDISFDSIKKRMEMIRGKVEEIAFDDFPDVRITMSFGVIFGDGKVRDMVPKADELLYKAKSMRNAVEIDVL